VAVAIYPGSFDPVTKGHVDIAERAAALFEEVVVAVYAVPPKHLMFSTEERLELLKKALSHLPNVRAEAFTGLTVDFAKKKNADVMVRGLRMSSDFEREFEMAQMNKRLAPDIELICFMTRSGYEFVSSSLLKEISELGGNIDEFVPKDVADAMKEKFFPNNG
jgi:pantetheine-phosphate adenylyltransferase